MSHNLHLHLNNNDTIYGFQPVKLVLREEISQISTGELLVYSEENIASGELKKILNENAALVIEGDSTFRRCYAGIVTSAKQLGLVAKGVYAYELIIAPPIVKLKHSARSAFYQNKCLKVLINDLLKKCGYAESGIEYCVNNETILTAERNFYQNNESDFAFFSRVLMFYGLNWISFSPFPDKNSNHIPESKLYICSTGKLKPVSDIQSSVAEITESKVFTCEGDLSDVNSMHNWHFRKQTGNNGLRCTSQTGIKTICAQQGELNKTRVVNSGMFTNLTQDQLNKLTANCLHAARTKYVTHHAQTEAFSAMPGNKIVLNPFNNESGKKTARVYASCLVAKSTTDIFEVNAITENSLQIDFSAVEENADNLFANAVYTPKKNNDYSIGEILQAVVCDNDLHYKSNDVNKPIALTDRYTFYAFSIPELAKIEAENKTPTSKDRIEVHLLQSLGGNKQGLFRIPRTGDRVLLYSVGTEHFLLSWLPDKEEMPIVEHSQDLSSNYSKNEMTVFRHISANNDNKSELDFFSSTDVKKAFNSTPPPGKKIVTTFRGSQKIYTLTESNAAVDQTLLYSSGELHLQAKKVQSVFSSKVHIGTASKKEDGSIEHNGVIHIYNADKIVFDFDKSLTMKVDKHYIVIDEGGIRLSSSVVTDNSGPMKAELSLSGLRGILGSGIKCHFHGITGCSVSEGSGASVALESSAISVGAAKIALQTLKSIPTGITIAGTISQAIAQYANMGNGDKSGGVPYIIASYLPVLWGSGTGVYDAIFHGSGKFKTLDIIQQVILLVQNILFTIYDSCALNTSSWWDDENSHGVTRRDQFGIVVHSYVMAAYIAISIFSLMRTFLGESKLYMQGSSIAKETKTANDVNRIEDDNQSVASGLEEPRDNPENDNNPENNNSGNNNNNNNNNNPENNNSGNNNNNPGGNSGDNNSNVPQPQPQPDPNPGEIIIE